MSKDKDTDPIEPVKVLGSLVRGGIIEEMKPRTFS
jgi:hypothetical protein